MNPISCKSIWAHQKQSQEILVRPDQTLGKRGGLLLPLRVCSPSRHTYQQIQTGFLPAQQGSQPGPIFLRFLPHAHHFALQLEPHPYFPQRSGRLQQKLKNLSLFGPALLLCGHRGAGGTGLPGRSQHWPPISSLEIDKYIYIDTYSWRTNCAFAPILHSLVSLGPGFNTHPKQMIQNAFNIYHKKNGITQQASKLLCKPQCTKLSSPAYLFQI